MKVWIGYECYSNTVDVWEYVEKIFDDEVKALLWVEDSSYQHDECEWRYCEEWEVE
jgi:hypothetical protein